MTHPTMVSARSGGTLAAVTVVFAVVPSATTGAQTARSVLAPMSGSYEFKLTFDGLTRDYRVHVPPAAARSRWSST
jgi:hypothetical protein